MNSKLYELVDLEKKTDHRGWFLEILRRENLRRKTFGQMFVIKFNKGKTRGGHYHLRKTEWFYVALGKIEFELLDTKTKQSYRLVLSDRDNQVIGMNPRVCHWLHNRTNGPALVLGYVSEPYDPKEADTFYVN